MTDDVRKLLGGYATGTLSPDERQSLFEAAIHDDELFAALSDEQALKDLLDDGTVRAQLLRATEEPRFSVRAAFREWFERPRSKALVATGAVLLAAIAFQELRPKVDQRTEIAEFRAPVKAPGTPSAAPVAEPPIAKEAPRKRPPENLALLQRRSKPGKEESDKLASASQPAPVESQPSAGPGVLASRREMRLADAAQPAAAPPPPPAAQTVRISSALLRHELLLQGPDGEFRAVPGNHEFASGDIIRVRVTSAREGAAAISAANQQTVVVPVRANEPAMLPAGGGITITSGIDKLVLGFAISGADLTSARRAASNRFTTAEAVKATQASAPSLTIEIPIRHRKQ